MPDHAPTTPCKHKNWMKSCGIKVCFDCGAPLNERARRVAEAKRKLGHG